MTKFIYRVFLTPGSMNETVCPPEINVATEIIPATVPSLKMFAICNPFPFPLTIMSLTAVDALSFI